MVTHTISSTSSSSSTGQPALCPCCKASRVKIRTSVHILYEVVSHRESDELLVVDENVEESGWEPDDEVFCPYCAWIGTVAELAG